jgi:serine/threonine protein kinase
MRRVVALKVLSHSGPQSQQFLERFQREVEAVARLSHPNIVMAHDADEAAVGPFLVMEFVNGRDLASEVDARGPLPFPEAVACLVQAARALEYAHGQGIIHRDIKPANLLRDVNGVVKVADLGLARFNDPFGRPAAGVAALTQAGTIMGTVDFMSPEQALGLTDIDHRTDIYSLGCTLYYLLLGQPPYEGPTVMAILLQHREGPIPSLCAARGEVPARLDQAFQRMVAKKPQERFASMTEVLRALEPFTSVPDPLPKQPQVPTARPPEPPALSAQPTQVAAVNQTIDLAPIRELDTGAATILLVEPSRAQAVIIRKYLQDLGFGEVLTTSSGQKALDSARGSPPRVVISAMHLTDMTGIQLAQKMRAEHPVSPPGFVLITSHADAEEANLLSQAGHTIRLPKPFNLEELAQALARSQRSEVRGQKSGQAEPTSDLRVLVVDDSAAARSHIRGVLAGLGLRQLVEATDGVQAVTLLQTEAFDLVVTDYNMPRLDGRELIDFIRHRSSRPSVPVILVTTETDPAKLEAVRQLGVSAICGKSFEPGVVRGILERLG